MSTRSSVDETVGSDDERVPADPGRHRGLLPRHHRAAGGHRADAEDRRTAPRCTSAPRARRNYIVFNTKTGKFAPTSTCGQALQKLARAPGVQLRRQQAGHRPAPRRADLRHADRPDPHLDDHRLAKIDPYATPNSAGDPAKAKSMLAAAGYPNGLTCTFLYRAKSKGADHLHDPAAGPRQGRASR